MNSVVKIHDVPVHYLNCRIIHKFVHTNFIPNNYLVQHLRHHVKQINVHGFIVSVLRYFINHFVHMNDRMYDPIGIMWHKHQINYDGNHFRYQCRIKMLILSMDWTPFVVVEIQVHEMVWPYMFTLQMIRWKIVVSIIRMVISFWFHSLAHFIFEQNLVKWPFHRMKSVSFNRVWNFR